MAFDIMFWILAVVAVAAALMVVLLRNIFRAALAMVLCFTVIAGLYATLGADFLAIIQILIYVGAISILIILAIMLTRDVWQAGRASVVGGAAVIAFLLFGTALVVGLSYSKWHTATPVPPAPTSAPLGLKLFGESGFTLPLMIAGAMLLAAIIGALVLIRDE
ncbi:MAG: NADH-quinone oxidoreductase subunit J [Dehalococcoidia bacterium]|nr:NADH-quinone oxidoreductase subunit J [Dehalococcoidia bacterium]